MFASFYRSPSMNSECSLALLLSTGEILWTKGQTGSGEHGRGVGPWGVSALRYDNGNPLWIFCGKDTHCHPDMETAEFIGEPKLLTDNTTDAMRAAGIYKEQSLATYSSIDDPFT